MHFFDIFVPKNLHYYKIMTIFVPVKHDKMSKTMTHKDFLNILQKTCQTDKSETSAKLSQYIKDLAARVANGESCQMGTFGMIEGHRHAQYERIDEMTGELTLYPPRISVTMRSVKSDKPSDDIVANVIESALTDEPEVNVAGLGTFRKQTTVMGTRVTFLPDNKFREMCNAPFACFSPITIK